MKKDKDIKSKQKSIRSFPVKKTDKVVKKGTIEINETSLLLECPVKLEELRMPGDKPDERKDFRTPKENKKELIEENKGRVLDVVTLPLTNIEVIEDGYGELDDVQVGFAAGLIACGVTDKALQRVLNISDQAAINLRRMYKSGELDARLIERAGVVKKRLPNQIMEVINQVMGILSNPEKLAAIPAEKLVTCLATLIDKYRLISGESTNNVSIVSKVQAMNDPRRNLGDLDEEE